MQSRNTVRAIKERLNIVDIVRRYVELKRNGARWTAPCPFHQETKPSFFVNEEQGQFYCFGCQASGDIFEFFSKINGLNFKETLEQLAAEAGVSLERSSGSHRDREQADKPLFSRRQMLRMYETAAAHFAAALKKQDAAQCRAYIEKRGLDKAIVQRFGLGWASREWGALAETLRRTGFDAHFSVDAGLLNRSAKGHVFDRFRGRLIFPIKNLANQVIAFGGRIITLEEDEAKYINSADTPIYKKGEHLYGLSQARRGIAANGRALLTEGYIDVLTLHQFGYDNAVGVLGTALTPEQLKRLSGFTSEFTLLFDGDRAGRKAAFRSCEMMLARGLNCNVALMPDGEDIDSLLRKKGVQTFETLQKHAPDGLRFCIDVLKALAPRETVEWAKIFLRHLLLPELLSPYISRLATHLQLSESVLREGLADWHDQNRPARKAQGANSSDEKLTRQTMRDKQIMMYAVRYPDRLEDLRSLGADMALQSATARSLWEKIEEWGEEAHFHLDEQEKILWSLYRGAEAAPRDNGDKELESLSSHLNTYYDFSQKTSVSAVLRQNTGTGDFASDLDYLRALQKTLERGNG
ncbi:DNA primase [Candidatus Desulfovibrio trichonymphae]|uniref:DNA primase n=1 Tax=Candidatus Desulfovibrio trichonymphae TaxID=1725232 RepID=A0A1J1DTM5_9BACT|nr:DNA primase [Candidatus Desulfovibrio trichonymphae]BAV92013.1 DNA primase [Candidatus Desulfovibrio trichonymphae]